MKKKKKTLPVLEVDALLLTSLSTPTTAGRASSLTCNVTFSQISISRPLYPARCDLILVPTSNPVDL